MRKSLFGMIMLLSIATFAQKSDSVSVTYIANSGYFIESGEKNILIDAVFDQCIRNSACPDSMLISKIINGKPPFEKIDFVMVTHHHPDHINDSLIFEMLRLRNDFELIIPQQVFRSLSDQNDLSEYAERIHSVKLDTAEITQIVIRGTTFNIARTRHANTYDTENLSYIINDDGFRLLHTGDCWPESITNIDKSFYNDIDLAIIPISFGKDRFVAHDTILKPRHTIISHIKTDFKEQFKKIIKTDTATFGSKDVLFEPYERVSYKR